MLSDRRSFLRENVPDRGAEFITPGRFTGCGGSHGGVSTGAVSTAVVSTTEEKESFRGRALILQNMGTDEVTIMWITHKNCFSWVEYGAGTYTSKREFGYNNGLIEANNRINKVSLTNLTPGTEHK